MPVRQVGVILLSERYQPPSMSLQSRLQGRGTQFYIELLYGALFISGFGYLVFRVDPRIAAFEGGLVVGYLLRVWEKMSIYERILAEAVSREAEQQVAAEVDEQVEDEVEAQVASEVTGEVEKRVADEISEEVESEVSEQFAEEVDEQVSEEVAEEVEEQVAAAVEERVADDA